MMRVLSRPQSDERTLAPMVEIIDERDLARGRLVDLREASQATPKGWQGLTHTIAAFLSDDMHLETSPELAHDIGDAHAFINRTVMPAFEEVRAVLESEGRNVLVSNSRSVAILRAHYEGRAEFTSIVRTRLTPTGVVPVFEMSGPSGSQTRRGIACVHLDGMTRVMTAQTGEVPQQLVVGYVLACHRDVRGE